MYVRDDITCPHCGKSGAFDCFIVDMSVWARSITFRTECGECLAFSDCLVSMSLVRHLLRELAELLPNTSVISRCKRWKFQERVSNLTFFQASAVRNSALLFFEEGVVRLETVKHPLLIRFVSDCVGPLDCRVERNH